MQRLVLASDNPGKLREFAALLAPLGLDAVAQGALGIGEADEPHGTFVENAIAKARHASAIARLPALADDSGLCVDALGGLPGVRSARYADPLPDVSGEQADGREGRDRRNNAKLVAALEDAATRDAAFVCVLVFLRTADDPEPIVATGRWRGTICLEPRGTGGFGYDPHFVDPSLGRSAAELDRDTKNRVSHRALAFRALVDALAARGPLFVGVPAASTSIAVGRCAS